MLTNGKWIAIGIVAAALILTFKDGIYERQTINHSTWYLVNKFTGEAAHICDGTGCVTMEEHERRLQQAAVRFRQMEAERKAEQERQLEESRRLGEERRERERQEAQARWTEKLIEHGLSPEQAQKRIEEHLASGTLLPHGSDFWINSLPEVVEKRRDEVRRRIDERMDRPTAVERFQAQREAERPRLPWMDDQ